MTTTSKDAPKWYWDVRPLTFGRGRLLWTDGFNVKDMW